MKILKIKQPDGTIVNVPIGKGADGKSAYEYAQDGGYTGTEAEFAQLLGNINSGAGGDYTLPEAGTSLGGVKTGGDVTISSGVITVNDDSHNHTIANVDNLQSALDGKASKDEGTFYIEGSGTTDSTAKTSTWVGSSDRITEYYDGLAIRYKIGVAGQTTTTLNINNLGAKPIYLFNTTKVTTQFPVNSIINLIYHTGLNSGCWMCSDYDSNTNTYQRVYESSDNKEYAITTRYNTTDGASYYAEYGRYTNGVTLNPSTNTITATKFKGALTGNADTATKATQDASGKVIASTYETKTDASAKITSHNTDTSAHADIREQISQLSSEKVDIPDYWYGAFTDRYGNTYTKYLDEKMADIKALQDEGGKDCFSFVVITDIHYEQNLGKISPKLAKKIADECGIKYVLILGDSGTRNGILYDLAYIDTEWDNIENMITPIRDRLLITDGNHDGSYGATDGDGDGVIDDVHGSGNSAFNFTPQKKYNRIKRKVSLIDGVTFDESGCGYYADDKTAKIRYIVLSTHNNRYEENADGSSKYSNMMNFRYGQSQFDLVINALNTLEEGWSVLVASHVPLDRSGELLPWGATEVNDNRLVSGEVECWLMADVLNAFVNKGTHKGSFIGTQGATTSYHNLVNKTEDLDGDGKADWLTGYRTSSSGVSQEAGYDVTNFLGDGKTPVGNKTIYFKNCKISNQRLYFYDADKKPVYNCYPTTFSGYTGFDNVATEGSLYIDAEKSSYLGTTAVYVRLCTVSGDDNPIITLDEPIVANGATFDAVSVDVDFTNAKGTLIGYFGGHVHQDKEWGTTYTWNDRLKQCDFWTIATRCDGHNENDSSLNAEKVKGTVTEQSFDVFTVNKAEKKIYATKIGAGADREISY